MDATELPDRRKLTAGQLDNILEHGVTFLPEPSKVSEPMELPKHDINRKEEIKKNEQYMG